MPSVEMDFKVSGQEQYRRLSRKLKEAGRKDLLNELRRNIRKEGDPAVQAVRRAVMGVHVVGDAGGMGRPKGSTNLRARIAGATRVSATQNGILIEVVGSQVGAYGTKLAKYMNATPSNWRHPVFGNRRNWRGQVGSEYFANTIRGYAPQFERACRDAMDDIARQLAG
jgi:hypothetical protein